MRIGGYRGRRAGSAMSPELKYVDTAISQVCDTTGAITLLNTVPQGAGESARIGRKINIRSIECHLRTGAEATTVVNQFRWMLVYDRQPNKALAAITDVLNSVDPNALKNDQNRERFLVIKDKTGKVIGNNTTAGQQTDCTINVFKYYKRCKLPVVYGTAGTGAIGDITTGALLLLTCGQQAAGTSDNNLVGNVRIRFDDN